MGEVSYFKQVEDALQRSHVMHALGFRKEDVNAWGRGMNHDDLLVVSKLDWTIRSVLGQLAMYEGVNVHFECRRPGALQLDCELTPRLGGEGKADQNVIAPLLELKGKVTTALRERLVPALGRFAVNLKHIRKEGPAHPSSLKVLGFELGLPSPHSPQALVAKIEPIISHAAPLIDAVIRDGNWQRRQASVQAKGPAMSGAVPSDGKYDLPPIADLSILDRIRAIQGLPERNMEDVVKRFLILLGHPEDRIAFQIGHVDVRVTGGDDSVQMVLEVKKWLTPTVLLGAVDQAFGYADRVNARLVVVSDSDRYEIYDRSRGGDRVNMYAGWFQLTRYKRTDDPVLDLLRPAVRACPYCRGSTPGHSRFCRSCGKEMP